MAKRRILAAILLTVFVGALIGAFVEQVSAVADTGGDTDMMDRKGIGGLFKSRGDKNDPRKPTKTQMYMGLGSLVVMVLVVKYL